MSFHDILIQTIGLVGVIFFLTSYQVRSNKGLFMIQTFGCLSFVLQFLLLGAYSGCLSLLINIIRNTMLTKYKEWAWVRWRGWVLVFSLLAILSALLTWDGLVSILPVAGTIAGTAAYWTNHAGKIRMANLFVNAPCMLVYDILAGSWGGVLNETITIVSILLSILRFGWSALNGDTISDAKG